VSDFVSFSIPTIPYLIVQGNFQGIFQGNSNSTFSFKNSYINFSGIDTEEKR
jgi:hypothetical protein